MKDQKAFVYLLYDKLKPFKQGCQLSFIWRDMLLDSRMQEMTFILFHYIFNIGYIESVGVGGKC